MTTLEKLLFLKSAIPSEPKERTITGNPVSFRTKYAEAMKLVIPFTPVQAGSGTPSPENVRSISGFDAVTINVSATQTGGTEYTISFPEEAGTVYGGTLTVNDDKTGTLVVTHKSVTLSEASQLSNFGTSASYGAYARISVTETIKSSNTAISLMASNCIPIAYNDRMDATLNHSNRVYAYTNLPTDITIRASVDLGISNVNDLFAVFEGGQFVYELATPVTYNLTPDLVKSIIGQNNVWTNTNEQNTVTYLK